VDVAGFFGAAQGINCTEKIIADYVLVFRSFTHKRDRDHSRSIAWPHMILIYLMIGRDKLVTPLVTDSSLKIRTQS
jgi:hypothetical protein